MRIIVGKRGDAGEIAIVFVDAEVAVFHITRENVGGQTRVIVRNGVEHDLFQIVGTHHNDVQTDVGTSGKLGRIRENIPHPSVLVRIEQHVDFRRLRGQIHGFDSERHIRAGFDVIFDDVVEVYIADHVTVGHDDILILDTADGVIHTLERFQSGTVQGVDVVGVRSDVRRQDFDTTGTARQIPVLTGTDVVHQGLVVVMCDDVDVVDVGVDHIRQRKVDEAVPTTEGNGRDGPVPGQLRDIMVVNVGKYNAAD